MFGVFYGHFWRVSTLIRHFLYTRVLKLGISDRIKEERNRLRYTQAEFAGLAGLSQRTQMGWEHGRSYPDARVLQAWHEAGVDSGYIISGVRTGSALDFSALDDREQNLINKFRITDEQSKSMIEAAVNAAVINLIKKPMMSEFSAADVFSIPEPTIEKKNRA